MTPNRLVLWDIDHTLISSGGVGSEVFGAAFEEVTGVPMKDMAAVAGRTEPDIFRETLHLHGIQDPGDYFHRFAAAQARGYEERADDMRRRGRILPGAEQALATVAARPGIVQSVLTGNTRLAAQVKLRIFGLDPFIDFDSGAYGDDDTLRPNLVAIARTRANARYGARFDETSIVLIGDTPKDVEAGLKGGAAVIGVASGKTTVEELADAGANEVLPDLTDTATLLRALDTLAQHPSPSHD